MRFGNRSPGEIGAATVAVRAEFGKGFYRRSGGFRGCNAGYCKTAHNAANASAHLAQTTAAIASVSAVVTTDLAGAAHNIAGTSYSLAQAAAVISEASPGVVADIVTTAHNAAAASAGFVQTATAIAGVADDVTTDVSQTAHNAAAASENTVAASRNAVEATKDLAEIAAALVGIARLDVRAILTQFTAGNIGNLKDLAGFIIRNIPQGAARVGSIFRRGGG